MSKGQSLQDPFLNTLRKERIPVSIFLVNGIKLQGQIESFDQFVVLLKNAVSQMVYKHAISTVVPTKNVRLPVDGDEDDDDEGVRSLYLKGGRNFEPAEGTEKAGDDEVQAIGGRVHRWLMGRSEIAPPLAGEIGRGGFNRLVFLTPSNSPWEGERELAPPVRGRGNWLPL